MIAPDAPDALDTEALTVLRRLVGRQDATFHDGQREAILSLVRDRQRSLVVQRTGWGKSAVYFLSLIHILRQVQDQILNWVPGDFASLGADGFGFSDTRAAARRYFHIDGPSIVVRTLQQLAAAGQVDPTWAARAAEQYRLHDVTAGQSGSVGGDA